MREILNQNWAQTRSNYPLRVLRNLEDSFFLSEEERQHMHIMGTTRVGKSRFLEWLMRRDIDRLKADEHLPNEDRRSIGFCFLDPSDRGDTMYRILRYCAALNYKKVLVIDPHSNKIAPINPLTGDKEAAVGKIMDAVRVLYQVSDASRQARIEHYLRAILSVLHNANLTLHDALYFTKRVYELQRHLILDKTPSLDQHRLTVEEVYTNRSLYNQEFQTTVRRFEYFTHPALDLMFGSRKGINFSSLIGNGWVVLVNLYSGLGLEEMHSRLIGTMIINEIIDALDRMILDGFKKQYYLYIDEAGEYATRKLARLLALKGKSGLIVHLSHQYSAQFEDRYIAESVFTNTNIKTVFRLKNSDDARKMANTLYGGELVKKEGDKDISSVLMNLPQREAIIRKPIKPAMRVRIPDVFDVELSDQEYEEYLAYIYSHEWYLTPEEIWADMRDRIEVHESTRTSSVSSTKTPKTAHRPVSKGTAPRRPANLPAEWEDTFKSLREDEISYPTNVANEPPPNARRADRDSAGSLRKRPLVDSLKRNPESSNRKI
ncbi:MAG: type IV secretory system conjugative DNA transfer family protein [Blastocatellia bacterium]